MRDIVKELRAAGTDIGTKAADLIEEQDRTIAALKADVDDAKWALDRLRSQLQEKK